MRTIQDTSGITWMVEAISHGRTSGYLSARIHRPVLQFTCLEGRKPRRYAPMPQGRDPDLGSMSDAELLVALRGARPY